MLRASRRLRHNERMRSPIAALVLLVACEHGQTPVETAIVAPVKTPCQGFGPTMCLTMVPDQKPMERLFFGIVGYEHLWGVESEITFRREQVEEPVPDGPFENIVLLDTIVENDIPGPFILEFPFGPGWFQTSGSALNMHGTTVECEATLCSQILSLDGSGSSYTVTVELTGDPNILTATGVL